MRTFLTFLLLGISFPLFAQEDKAAIPVEKEGLYFSGEAAFLINPAADIQIVLSHLESFNPNHIGVLPTPKMAVAFFENPLDSFELNNLAAEIASLNEVDAFCPSLRSSEGSVIRLLPEVFIHLTHPLFEEQLKAFCSKGDIPFFGKHPRLSGIYKIGVPSGLDSRKLCLVLEQFDWVDFAQANFVFNPVVASVNDPLFNRQWSFENGGSPVQGSGLPGADISMLDAWTITTGDSTIKVAVIDSGVDTLHPDLVNNLLDGYDAVSDSTGGYPTTNYPNDGHGTACAGIIAAEGDNNIGTAGVAYNCTILPIRAFYYTILSPQVGVQPFSTPEAFALATDWAWRNGADVMSNSWSLTPDFEQFFQAYLPLYAQSVQVAMDSGRNGLGVPMFYSSGNENADMANWPARINDCISIGATSMCDERKSPADCSTESWGGNYGDYLDFSAPGVRIPSSDMRGTLGYNNTDNTNTFNGTSAACPHAAGVAALVLSVNPNLSAYEVRMIMSRSCDRVGGYAYDSLFSGGTWSWEMGFGRLNAYAAVQMAAQFNSTQQVALEEGAFSIFPNPNDGLFTVACPGYLETDALVLDVNGKVVERVLFSGEKFQVDISEKAMGTYFVYVRNGSKLMLAGTVQKKD